MDSAKRPLRKREAEELRGVVAPTTALFRGVLFLLAAAFVGWLCWLVLRLLGTAGWWWLLPTLVVMAVLFRRARRWTGGASLRRRVRRDLAAGEARVTVVEAVSAIGFAEVEDEGPTWLVECAGGESLLFAGQYLERLERRGFPWRSFAIVEAPRSGIFFGLEKRGERLEAVEHRGALSYRRARELGILDRSYVELDAAGRELLGL